RRFSAIQPPGEPRHRESREQSGKSARKVSGGFAHTEELETQTSGPVVERRFFKPGLAVQSRRDPVTGFRHVARDPGVARLVRADKSYGAEIVKIAEVQCGEDQRDPGEAYREGRGLPFSSRVLSLRHGTMSLAFSVYLGMAELPHTGLNMTEEVHRG